MDWKNSSLPNGTDFDSYILQVATDSNFSALVIDEVISGQANSEFTPLSDLLPNTKYYWRVGAYNTVGQYSQWSAVRYFREAIMAPELISPANGALPDQIRPAFDWQDVEGASNYTIQISSSSNMRRPIISARITESEYVPTKDLLKNKTLFWRVTANGENGPSDWSEIWNLASPNPPSTPNLLTPANNALLTDLRPRLDWKNSSLPSGTDFDSYILQVATDSSFNNLVINEMISGQANSEYMPLTDLLPNTLYYWRVQATNTAGQYSSWSVARYFREAMLAPDLLAPADGSMPDNLRPVFDWEDVDGASSYTIQVSAKSNMKSPILYKSAVGSQYMPTMDLTKNKTLYWRVRANGANGPSEWSEIWTLTSPNPPSRPNLVAPSNNALLTDLTPRLDWSNSIVPSGMVFDHYQLQVATDSGFSSLVIDQNFAGQTNSEYTLVVDLLPNTRYYWRVRAFNTTGQYSSWSSARYFREKMLAPNLIGPLDGAVVGTVRPPFDWEDTNGATSYKIQISRYSSLIYPLVNKTVANSEYLPTKDLTKNKTLYWRVRVNGPNGPSPWSEVRTLMITLP